MACARFVGLVALLSWLSSGAVAIAEPLAEFIPLGRLTTDVQSIANGISADGRVVVGASYSPAAKTHAFYWTKATGMRAFDVPPSTEVSSAYDVSADGRTVVGYMSGASGTTAVRWIDGVPELLPTQPANWSITYAGALSRDGLVMTGHYDDDSSSEIIGYRWSSSTGFVTLGRLSDEMPNSNPHGISGDGSTIVGLSHDDSSSTTSAFRWTALEGIASLDGAGRYSHSRADDASFDGSVIVGTGRLMISDRSEAFRWTAGEGIVPLGGPSATISRGSAQAITPDGKTIVGGAEFNDPFDSGPFVWNEQHGMRSLARMLRDSGISLDGWDLGTAIGVSDDGRTITGFGKNPKGENEAWVAVLPVPEPGTYAMLLTAFAAAVLGYRVRLKVAAR